MTKVICFELSVAHQAPLNRKPEVLLLESCGVNTGISHGDNLMFGILVFNVCIYTNMG